MSETNLNARKKARTIAMQSLYQWAMSSAELHTIEMQYIEHNEPAKIDLDYFRDLLYGVPKCLDEIDPLIKQYIDRDINDLNPVELAVMRLATYELLKRLDVPYKVVINESLSLAKKFGSTSGHKYVNGILDKIAKKIRIDEINSHS